MASTISEVRFVFELKKRILSDEEMMMMMFTSCYYFSFRLNRFWVCECVHEFFWKRKNKDPRRKEISEKCV